MVALKLALILSVCGLISGQMSKTNPYTGKKYLLLEEYLEFDEQVELCKQKGGKLAEIRTQQESNWIENNVLTGDEAYLFIGTKVNGDEWTWMDGTPMTWKNF